LRRSRTPIRDLAVQAIQATLAQVRTDLSSLERGERIRVIG
jgi:hypothetical protein